MTRNYTVQELQQHARDVAKTFDVILLEDSIPNELSTLYAASDRTGKLVATIVHVQVIINHRNYAIALHELGHVLHPSGLITGIEQTIGIKIMQEESAWEWARHHALTWNADMELAQKIGLDSYYDVQKRLQTPKVYPRRTRSESINDFLNRRLK